MEKEKSNIYFQLLLHLVVRNTNDRVKKKKDEMKKHVQTVTSFPPLCRAGDRTLGLKHARQMLYH